MYSSGVIELISGYADALHFDLTFGNMIWTGYTRTQRRDSEPRSQALQFYRMERIQGCLQKVKKAQSMFIYSAISEYFCAAQKHWL